MSAGVASVIGVSSPGRSSWSFTVVIIGTRHADGYLRASEAILAIAEFREALSRAHI